MPKILLLATGPRHLHSAPEAVLNGSRMLVSVAGLQGVFRINIVTLGNIGAILGAMSALCPHCAKRLFVVLFPSLLPLGYDIKFCFH